MPAISELAAATGIGAADLLPVVDVIAGATKKATAAEILKLVYPVGSLYFGTTPTDPATLFGFGTWAAFGAGRVPVGFDGADLDFDTDEKTGGAKSVTLTAAQSGAPAHTHPVTDPGHTHVQGVNSATTGGLSGYTPDTSSNTRVNSGYSTSSATTGLTVSASAPADAAEAHPNLPPYVVVRMWKRVA
jgi:microcystin-dependent protein